jgi:2-keto-4-pentenoate hydratase/2-oxohepta-3-ene-1,7-dioic acid hydratase in catechol pathway
MRLVAYQLGEEVRHGRLDGDVVHDLGPGDVLAAVAGAAPGSGGGSRPLADVRLLAPIRRPGKLLAVAANYQAHVTEGGGDELDKARLSPRLFLKPSTSISGPNDAVAVPSVTRAMDWEAELAVVIGTTCKDVSVGGALDQVFGYMASNDISARSLELGYERDTSPTVGFFDWLEGKWPDGFAPCGPWVATADEVPDPQDLDLRLELNGEVRQQASTSQMIFSVAELVSFASRLMTLEPGDVIMTGTPAGTGAASKRFLRPGDEMTVAIEGLGRLTTRVVEG